MSVRPTIELRNGSLVTVRPTVTVKRRTILVWQCPDETTPHQSEPATDKQIERWLELLKSQDCRALYLVRCTAGRRPRR